MNSNKGIILSFHHYCLRLLGIIVLLCFSTLSVQGQRLTIIDQDTKEPIEGAIIEGQNNQSVILTDSLGQADIAAIRDEKNMVIRSLGYQTRQLSYFQLEQANYIVSLSSLGLSLEKVVVSATRWRQNQSDVPALITDISRTQVALHQPQTAADLLQLSGKVFIQKSQQGGGSPMIRGFATNRLLYSVDGVRMNTAIFRSGNIQNVINIDPYTLSQTEVLFGPGSVIYGSDAIGGVMSFQTLTPRLSSTARLSVHGKANARTASANKEASLHMDVNLGTKKWAFLTSISSWDFDHLRQGRHGPSDYIKPYFVQRHNQEDVRITSEDPLLQIPSAYSQMNLMQKVRFEPNQHWQFNYAFHFSETSAFGRYDRHNRIRNGNPRYGQWDYGPQSWLMNLFSVTQTSPGLLYDQLQLRLSHQEFGESRISRNWNDPLREQQHEKVRALAMNLDLKKQLQQRHQLFYGLEVIHNRVRSDGQITNIIQQQSQNGPNRYPQASWLSCGLYLKDVITFDTWTLHGGLRWNIFRIDADFQDNLPFYPLPFAEAIVQNSAWSGSLGAVYRPSKNLVVQGNAGLAFRAPNVDDIGKIFDSEPGAVVVPNLGLQAETAYNLDLGLAYVYHSWLKLDVTTYYTFLDQALVRRPFQLNGQDSIVYNGVLSQVQAIQNATNTTVYGVQAGMEVVLGKGFHVSTDVNWQYGEDNLQEGISSPSRHVAPFFGVSRIQYRGDRILFQLYCHLQGAIAHEDLALQERDKTEIYALDDQARTYVPAWYTLNVKMRYQLTDAIQITAGMENITDQRYRPYSSGISGAGRNMILAAQVTF